MAVPGAVQAHGVVVSDPVDVKVSGSSQGGYTWLVVEDGTVEGTMDGTNWTALAGDTVAGTIVRFNVIGLTSVRVTTAGAKWRLVA